MCSAELRFDVPDGYHVSGNGLTTLVGDRYVMVKVPIEKDEPEEPVHVRFARAFKAWNGASGVIVGGMLPVLANAVIHQWESSKQ